MAAPAPPVPPDRALLARRLAAGGPVVGAMLFGLGYWVNFSGKVLFWEPFPALLMLAGYVLLGASGAVGLLVLRAGSRGGAAMLLALGAGLLGGAGMVQFRHWLPPLVAMGGCAFFVYRMVESRLRPSRGHEPA